MLETKRKDICCIYIHGVQMYMARLFLAVTEKNYQHIR